MIFEFKGFIPVIHETAFIHPQATIIGNVIIGKDVYIGPSSILRGDWGQIIVENGCNVQENCTVHMFPGKSITLREGAHVGHGAIVHGANLGKNCLVGMNAVLMDEAEIGDESIIGALTFVPAKMKILNRSLVIGNPAKIIRQVSDEMLSWKSEGTKLYQQLPKECQETMKEVNPLREIDADRPDQETLYSTWESIKEGG